MKDLKNIKNL